MDDIADTPTDTPTTTSFTLTPDNFLVPLRFELDQAEVSLARLQSVQEGAVLPLQDREGALAVRILAGSRAIATGQIVSIGEGYGVLVETILAEG